MLFGFDVELKHALRTLRSKPGFSAISVLTLALTIGAATTVFSLFDAVLLRPFPYKDPERLVRIRTEQPQIAGSVVDASIYDFWDWRRQATSFSGMAAYVSYSNNLTGEGPARSVRMTFATPELFSVLFPGRSPIGEQIRWGTNQDYDPWTSVIGVVGNTRWHPAEPRSGAEVYWSYLQYPSPNNNLIVRTTTDPDSLVEAIRRTIQEVNPDFAVESVQTMDTLIGESVWQRRLWAFVLATFATLALVLAVIGLYGVMSYIVSQRARDWGIRLAIGASPASVVALVLRGGMALVSTGIAVGLALAFVAARYLSSVLFGVAPTDAATFVLVPAVLATVALAACAAPAFRASRIDPLIALRQE